MTDSISSHSIHVYKQYFNFACAHFLIFDDGSREPLHGHNYSLECKATTHENLKQDMVMDFLDIKPIIRELCNEIDHRLILPKNHRYLRFETKNLFTYLYLKDNLEFMLPTKDILFLPIQNTSAERLAYYFTQKIEEKILEKFGLSFEMMEVSIEETPGQAASFFKKK